MQHSQQEIKRWADAGMDKVCGNPIFNKDCLSNPKQDKNQPELVDETAEKDTADVTEEWGWRGKDGHTLFCSSCVAVWDAKKKKAKAPAPAPAAPPKEEAEKPAKETITTPSKKGDGKATPASKKPTPTTPVKGKGKSAEKPEKESKEADEGEEEKKEKPKPKKTADKGADMDTSPDESEKTEAVKSGKRKITLAEPEEHEEHTYIIALFDKAGTPLGFRKLDDDGKSLFTTLSSAFYYWRLIVGRMCGGASKREMKPYSDDVFGSILEQGIQSVNAKLFQHPDHPALIMRDYEFTAEKKKVVKGKGKKNGKKEEDKDEDNKDESDSDKEDEAEAPKNKKQKTKKSE